MQILKNLLCLFLTVFISTSVVSQSWLTNQFNYANSKILTLNNQVQFLKLNKQETFFDNYPADVNRLNLSQAVIFDDCNSKEGRCSENKEKIEVWTEASDPFGDVLTYHYKVSGGKIIGKGEKVTWDLSEVEPGEYTIFAGVDDGCGICGKTKMRTIYVVECPEEVKGDIPPGFISALKISQTDIFSSCPLSKNSDGKSCMGSKSTTQIFTTAFGSNDSNAIYKYEVTGGQIVGNGDDVYWDLSKAKPGTYVITASVDAGRGFCSNSVSDSVRVVECPKCKK